MPIVDGTVRDLSDAIGLTRAGELQADWLQHPDQHLRRILSDEAQRGAALRAIDGLFPGEATRDAAGRQWVPVVEDGPITLCLTLQVEPDGGSVLGVGARVDAPGATPADVGVEVEAVVPVLYVPTGAPGPSLALGTPRGRVLLSGELALPASQSTLRGLGLRAEIPTGAGDALLAVRLVDLQLGAAPARTVELGEAGLADLQDDAIRLLVGLLREQASAATGVAAAVLTLLGLRVHPLVPALPVEELLAEGPGALQGWLRGVFLQPTALDAWLDQLRLLAIEGGATAPDPVVGQTLQLTIPSGPTALLRCQVAAGTGGEAVVTLGGGLRWTSTASTMAGIELDLDLLRFVIGPRPSLLGLPRLIAGARFGSVTEPLLAQPATGDVRVGARLLRVGLGLDEARDVAFVLQAEQVQVNDRTWPRLDLTNADAILEMGSEALDEIADDLLSGLGPLGEAVATLLGLHALPEPPPATPPLPPPMPLISVVDLLGAPLERVRDYHRDVMQSSPERWRGMLGSLLSLLGASAAATVTGDGTEPSPWLVPLHEGVSLTVWATPSPVVHVGLRYAAERTGLLAAIPTLRLALDAGLAGIDLAAPELRFLEHLRASLTLVGDPAAPLRLGGQRLALRLSGLGASVAWRDDEVGFAVDPSGLLVEVDGWQLPLPLPTLGPDGRLQGELPWRALELIAGMALLEADGPWARMAVDLFGWSPGASSALPLQQLVDDPAAALRAFVDTVDSAELVRLVSLLLAAPGEAWPVWDGRGDADAPLRVPLGENPDGMGAALTIEGGLWQPNVEHFRPDGLVSLAFGQAGELELDVAADQIATDLALAAASSRPLAELLEDRRGLYLGLRALVRHWAGSDGVVQGASATSAGATHAVLECAHDELIFQPEVQALLHGLGAAVVYVGFEPGDPGFESMLEVDLRAAGLPPEAFDLSRLAAQDGPWFVRLPRRADTARPGGLDPVAEQAARLRRVIAAVQARAAQPVTVVAKGTAGFAARAAARPGEVGQLITLSTPFGGPALRVLTGPGASAVQLLRHHLPAEGGPEIFHAVQGRLLLRPLLAVLERGGLEDWSPPAAPGFSVPTHTFGGALPGGQAIAAVAALVGRVMQAGWDALPGPEAPMPDRRLGLVRARAGVGTAVRASSELRASLWTVGADGFEPIVHLRLGVGRPDGWLVGGPREGVPGTAFETPALRRLEIEASLPLLHPDGLSLRLVLHEADALGVRHARRVLASAADLDEGARILLGRAVGTLGPVTPTSEARHLRRLLGVLGLLDSSATDDRPALAVEPFERLLADPWAHLEALRDRGGLPAWAAVLAAVLEAAPPSPAAPTVVTVDQLPFRVRVDVATGETLVTLDAHTFGGIGASGRLLLRSSGASGEGHLHLAGVVLDIGAGPGGPTLTARLDGSTEPPVPLYPTPSVEGLHRWALSGLPAWVLHALLGRLREADSAPLRAILDPLLRVLGLLYRDPDGAERLHVPYGLLHDPGGQLLGVLRGAGRTPEQRLGDLIEALRTIVGAPPDPVPGRLALGWGVTLAAGRSADGRARLGLGIAPVLPAGLAVRGELGLVLPSDTQAAEPAFSLEVGPQSPPTRLVATADARGFGLTWRVSTGAQVQLYPPGPGLAAAATAQALDYVLPLVLDKVVEQSGPVFEAIAAIGDGLGLRAGPAIDRHFVGAQLLQLADDPGDELVRRLREHVDDAFPALAALVQLACPSGWAASSPAPAPGLQRTFVLSRTGAGALTLRAPSDGLGLLLEVGPLALLTGTELRLALEIAQTELRLAEARFRWDPATPLVAGPLRLAPFIHLRVDRDLTGTRARVGAGLAAGARSVEGRLTLSPTAGFTLEPEAGGEIAASVVAVVLGPVMDWAISLSAVQGLLARPVFSSPVRTLLRGVILEDTGGPDHVDVGLLDTATLLPRALRLGTNLAAAGLSVNRAGLSVAAVTSAGAPTRHGLALTLMQRVELGGSDVVVALEVDPSWIRPMPAASGVQLFLWRDDGGTPTLDVSLALEGVGLRVFRRNGPLLDQGLKLDSVGVFGMLRVNSTGVTAGGGQVELGGLAVPLAGGSGDRVASGILSDASQGGAATAFSPALSVQTADAGVVVRFRAGPGDGPWWLPVQRAFGPVYLEQLGLDVDYAADGASMQAISLLVDGRLSLAGLVLAVDDLTITASFDPTLSWTVGMAGLGISSDISGVQISGALRKRPVTGDYAGMLTVRVGAWALAVYGAYGVRPDPAGGELTSMFVYGALNAPLGGPPAFFVTGIAAGGGINRRLVLPAQIDNLGSYPLIRALNRGAPMPPDPIRALDALEAVFPPEPGRFWLAAGLSFTSFALVDGVVIATLELGDGFEVGLLGLARAALPQPELSFVQLEAGLIARFSSREGVLWVQAQLTDNSYLLTPDCRLTGGFAWVMWFKGDKEGEFVLTLGGYHPNFHRDGYPVVPRLGYVWGVSDALVIKGESYFALTSEAIMAGTRFEAKLDAGPLWASLRWGGDAILYFDPFWFEVTAFAELAAGITIDIDLGPLGHLRLNPSVHLHADVLVQGPEVRGRAVIDLEVTSATITFGEWSGQEPPELPWTSFLEKYLASDEDAPILAVTPGRGVMAPSPGGDRRPPTGAPDSPLLMGPELTLELRTRAAATELCRGEDPSFAIPLPPLGLAPMGRDTVTSRVRVSLLDEADVDHIDEVALEPRSDRFPKGIWAARNDDRPVPTGEMLTAYSGLTLKAVATERVAGPEIGGGQVETGMRRPNPLVAGGDTWSTISAALQLIEQDPAESFLLGSGGRAPAMAAPVTRGMLSPTLPEVMVGPEAQAPDDPPFLNPALVWEATLTSASADVPELLGNTTVSEAARQGAMIALVPRIDQALMEVREYGVLMELVSAPADVVDGKLRLPRRPRTRGGAVAGERRAQGAGSRPFTKVPGVPPTQNLPGMWTVRPGEVLVLRRPQVPGGALALDAMARVIFLTAMGTVRDDKHRGPGLHAIPADTHRVVIIGGSEPGGLAGWQDGEQVAQVGAWSWVAPGATAKVPSATTRRSGRAVRHAWLRPHEVGSKLGTIQTRFTTPVMTAVVLFEPRDAAASSEDLHLAVHNANVVGKTRAIALGKQQALLLPLVPTGAGAVQVDVTSSARVHVAGVLGAEQSVHEVQTMLLGAAPKLSPLARWGSPVHVTWTAAGAPPPQGG